MKTFFFIIFCLLITLISCNKKDNNIPEEPSNDYRSAYLGNWHFTYLDEHNEWVDSTGSFNSWTDTTDYPNGKIELGSESNTLRIITTGVGAGYELVLDENGILEHQLHSGSCSQGGTITEIDFIYHNGCTSASFGTSTQKTIGFKL